MRRLPLSTSFQLKLIIILAMFYIKIWRLWNKNLVLYKNKKRLPAIFSSQNLYTEQKKSYYKWILRKKKKKYKLLKSL